MKTNPNKWLCCFALLTLLLSSCSADSITLVENGRRAATIVIRASAIDAPQASPRGIGAGTADQKVNLAARDLQQYICKISGATLPIASDEADVKGAVVLVGRSKLTESLGLKIPSGLTAQRREEGFVIRTIDDALVLAGNDEAPYNGTYYAVAELLHRLGVRWYMPTEFGEVVAKKPTISIERLDLRDSPDFPLRTYWSHMIPAMIPQEALWKMRNKMQPTVGMIQVAGDSMLNQYLPKPELATTRPELFGKGINGQPNPMMPNMTNPETVKIVADNMIAELRRRQDKPGEVADWLGFAPADGAPYDMNPETQKINMGFPGTTGREGVPQEVSISEEWFTFANAVAAEVVKEFPDVILTTNGYANRDVPPIGIKLHPNLSVMYSAIWADNLKALNHPKSWHSEMRYHMLKRWTELSDKVYTYDYFEMLMTSLTPTPVLRRHAADFPLFKKWGLFGFFHERRAAAYMEYGIPPRYFMARLMWDADLDIAPALKEYYDLWYGPAAKASQRFWDALENRMYDTELLGHEDRILPYVYTPELITTLEKEITKAEQLAKDEPYATHVRVDRLILDHLKAYLALHEAEFNADFAGAVAQADIMLARREEIHKINPFFHMLERFDITDGRGRPSGVYYWNMDQRKAFYRNLASLIDGATGDLITVLPRQAAFAIDPGDMGRTTGWYLREHDRTNWHLAETTKPYYLQGPRYLDEKSMPYAGAMWYAFEFDIPATSPDREVRFFAPVVNPEAWLWVNGEYVGRRKYLEPYVRPATMDLDITDTVQPGKRNLIVIRISTGANRTQAPDGMLGRAFLYSPISKSMGLQGR